MYVVINALLIEHVVMCVQWRHVFPHLAEMECLLLQTSGAHSETETNSIQDVGYLTWLFLD